MTTELHPWLNTAEAVKAAHDALWCPRLNLPGLFRLVGNDELESEALAILTGCALPPLPQRAVCAREGCGEELAAVRKGAKFCSQKCRRQQSMDVLRSKDGPRSDGPRVGRPRTTGMASADVVVDGPKAYVGSMWSWPVDQMGAYASRTVGLELCNWLRTRHLDKEFSASEFLANMHVAEVESDQSAYEFLTDWLESRGLTVLGDETFEELAEAASLLRGGHFDEMTCAVLMAA